jgi:23S rRNA (pseudouridine1915-N3)-methyltransferase
MKTTILAMGKLKGSEAELCQEYLKRLKGDVVVMEMAAPKSLQSAQTQKIEESLFLKALTVRSFVVLCDERGKDLASREFAAKLPAWRERGAGAVTFIIGGADGVTDAIRARAGFTLGFGRATWPHRLVRVMLLEQLYRAQQIDAGHPYHRD